MIDWQTLQFQHVWPLWLMAFTLAALMALWWLQKAHHFPDIMLALRTRRLAGLTDRVLLAIGCAILAALVVVMMQPSVSYIETIDQRARDFVILVDTSRSMRHDTNVERHHHALNYRRRVGAFAEVVDDPNTMPYLARYELARESLFRFLVARRAGDRVALVYFNDDTHPVSALTSNVDFVIDQLATMDDYVNWGTDIAAAVNSSLNLSDRYPGANKRTLILLTDAETRYTQELEQQLTRLANAGLGFYLLWITTDAEDLASEDATNFLSLARSVGSVFTIRNPNADNLRASLEEISRLEGYSYEEVRHRTVDLAQPILTATRVIALLWLLAVATIMHPNVNRNVFGSQTP